MSFDQESTRAAGRWLSPYQRHLYSVDGVLNISCSAHGVSGFLGTRLYRNLGLARGYLEVC